jgi:beta-glucanase (GH16 family)
VALPLRRIAIRRAPLARLIVPLAAISLLAFCGGEKTSASPSPVSQPGIPATWQLSWSDEFDSADSSRPDPTRWVYDLGGNGWGNNELETYTDRAENARIEKGALVITARAERFVGADGTPRNYTSARLKTLGRFAQTYGRFEARLQIPRGQGIWPAFWMLGSDIDSRDWPQCGEIDVMENIGREPTTVHGTMHGPGYSGGGGIGMPFQSLDGTPFAAGHHVYAVEWEPSEIRWYVDGRLYQTRKPSDLPAGARWVFDHDMFLLLNVAVGGNWPGSPDQSTVFPKEMLVDHVRVYRR